MAGGPTEVTSGAGLKVGTTNLTALHQAMRLKPLAPPEGFQTALDVTANVSDKNVLTPSVYQISADFMSTAAQFQTAARKKSNRVIGIEK